MSETNPSPSIFQKIIANMVGDLDDYSLENIIFNALLLVSAFTSFILSVKELIFHVSDSSMYITATTALIFITLYRLARRTKSIQWLVWVYLLVATLAIASEWFYIAGVDGVAWLIFLAICAATQVLLSGRHLIIANVWNYSSLFIIYLISINQLQTIPGLLKSNININYYLLDVAMLSASIGLLVHIVMRKYRKQHTKMLLLNDELIKASVSMEEKNLELSHALDEIRDLRDIIPICASCKSIRNDEGFFESVEQYIKGHSEVNFSHTICPDCLKKDHPEIFKKMFPYDDTKH